jgi:Topoisomerase C-terminal repeat
MSDVDAQEVTILSLAAEGGGLDLVGIKDHSGWRFQIRTGGGLEEEDTPSAGPWVRSWQDVLNQLESNYPYWRRLSPLHVEPDFRAQLLEAFRKADTTFDEVIDHNAHRWAFLLSPAKEITILSAGVEGWRLDLVGAKEPSGWRFGAKDYSGWRFQVRTTDAPLSLYGWIRSWREALSQLETNYPYWRSLIPLHIEPPFRAVVIAAFLGMAYDDPNRSRKILARWTAVLLNLRPSSGHGRRFAGYPGRTLGEHPTKGGLIVAKNGRYGPYVVHDDIIAKIPSDKTPDTITIEEAVPLLDGRTLGEHPSKGGLIVITVSAHSGGQELVSLCQIEYRCDSGHIVGRRLEGRRRVNTVRIPLGALEPQKTLPRPSLGQTHCM